MSQLSTTVFADPIEIRFPFSGQISQVLKKAGDTVKKGETLVKLNTKFLQTELDKELADYEKIRARFEIFNREHPTITDDNLKFLKVIEQADLNSSVKSVELVKMRLDQASLTSPINGLIVSDGGCRPSLFATPSSNSFTILDLDSLRLRAELDSPDLDLNSTFSVDISGQSYPLTSSAILPLGKKFILDLYFSEKPNLQIGTIFQIHIA